MTLTPQQQAVLYRFLLILVVTDLPILSVQLSQPVFDWRLLLAGLLTGAAGAVEKVLSPQLVTMPGGVGTLKQAIEETTPVLVPPPGQPGPTVASSMRPPSQSRAG